MQHGDMGEMPRGIHLTTFLGGEKSMAEASTEHPQEPNPTCPPKGLLVNKGISSKATKPSWGETGFLKVGLSGL